MRRFQAAILTLPFVFAASVFAAAQQEALTITNGASEDAANYEVEVTIDAKNTAFWAAVKKDGGDIRFKEAKGGSLSYFLDEFNYDLKYARVYVKVPSIPAKGTAAISL